MVEETRPRKGTFMGDPVPATGEFSVCQFFVDESYEFVRRGVTAEEAVEAAQHYCDNVASRMGIVRRVIITDDGDCTCFEWKYGEGVVFPPSKEKVKP